MSDIAYPMVKPTLYVSLGNEILADDGIMDFTFTSDENTFLPTAKLQYNDSNGNLLTRFKNISIGSSTTLGVKDTSANSNGKTYAFLNMVIGAIGGDISDITTSINTLELIFNHPWVLNKDLSVHAYYGSPNSEIIKGIIEDTSNRNFKFADIDSNYWEDSDESGKIPRYKVESDYDFILKKLLTVTTIGGKPITFFVDDKNVPKLSCFTKMFAQSPVALLIPSDTSTTEEYATQISKIVTNCNNTIIPVSSAAMKIGNENTQRVIETLKSTICYDDPHYNKSFIGTLSPKVSISAENGENVTGGKIPVSLEAMVNTNTTDNKYFRNRCISDQVSMSINTESIFNEMFTIKVLTAFCGNLVSVGQNINLFIPPCKKGSIAGLNHWMNGKWHIQAITHRREGGDMGSVLTLIRPSFQINKKNTTILLPDAFYGVM